MAKSRNTATKNWKSKGRGTEFVGLFFLFLSAFLFLSVLSFSPTDPSFNQAVTPGQPVQNVVGRAGSYCAGLLVEFFGMGAVFWPIYFLYLGLIRFVSRLKLSATRWLGVAGLFIAFEAWAMHPWFSNVPKDAYGLIGGGYLGRDIITRYTMPYLRPVGTFLLWGFVTIISLQGVLGFTWTSVWSRLLSFWQHYREGAQRRDLARAARRAARRGESVEDEDAAEDDMGLEFVDLEDEPTKSSLDRKPEPRQKPTVKPAVKLSVSGDLPNTALLSEPSQQESSQTLAVLQPLADRLKECLNDFNVQGEIQQVVPGPVVTMFEFKPAPGIKVSKIENLTDDIALALRAESVRIEAPIPGKDSVGIEIPNIDREMVFLREILESKEFIGSKSPLTLALGKDIHGGTRVADLAKMPHLLVAGATGAGKSVGINGFLLSLLFKASPEEVKLLLVDPKRIELAPYAELPHLVHPVVTDMNLAKSALEWAVFEMDCRYEKMAKLGVRNIEGYNKKLKELGEPLPENSRT